MAEKSFRQRTANTKVPCSKNSVAGTGREW